MMSDEDIRDGDRKAAIAAALHFLEADASLDASGGMYTSANLAEQIFSSAIMALRSCLADYEAGNKQKYISQSGDQPNGDYIIYQSDSIDGGFAALGEVLELVSSRFAAEHAQFWEDIKRYAADEDGLSVGSTEDGLPVYPPHVNAPRWPDSPEPGLTADEVTKIRLAACTLGARPVDLPSWRGRRRQSLYTGTRSALNQAFGKSSNYSDYLVLLRYVS